MHFLVGRLGPETEQARTVLDLDPRYIAVLAIGQTWRQFRDFIQKTGIARTPFRAIAGHQFFDPQR